MKERLQKKIAAAGITSRRKAEELIVNGHVKVNGIVISQLGTLVDDHDDIQVHGKTIKTQKMLTIMLNKPAGVLSSVSDDRQRKTVIDLISHKVRLFPVGRLDYRSTGLLLLTNDGDLAHSLTHPKYHLPKVYHVKIRGSLQASQIALIENGLRTKEEKYQPATIKNVKIDLEKKQTHFDITLYEGKNREIRKMMEHFHHEVLKLNRFQIGPLQLGKLGSGQYRELSQDEIDLLIYVVQKGMPK